MSQYRPGGRWIRIIADFRWPEKRRKELHELHRRISVQIAGRIFQQSHDHDLVADDDVLYERGAFERTMGEGAVERRRSKEN